MSALLSRLDRRLLLVPVVLALGCGPQATTPSTPVVVTAEPVSAGPGQVVLSDPKVTFTAPNQVRFEVHYRFTTGKPNKYYLCEILFPGTPNQGSKPMESWELSTEGVIKDGIVLFQPPVQTFEIRVSEANSPDEGYKLISNVVRGSVE